MNCSIFDNYADLGGGIFVENAASTIKECLINTNTASNNGGGIYCLYSLSFVVESCLIKGNYARHGGGLSIRNDSYAIVRNCVISDNQASYNAGGIDCSTTNSTISNCNIVNNKGYNAGGLYVNRGSIIEHCNVTNNKATWKGGGMCLGTGNPHVKNCILSMNQTTASHGGGGICCWGPGDPKIEQSVISHNYGSHGGGIYIIGNSTPMIENCIISGNKSNLNGSGIECDLSPYTQIISCSIIGNRSYQDYSSAVYFTENSSQNILMNNCLITNNLNAGVYWKYIADKNLSYNNVWGNTDGNYGGWATAGAGSISVDPLFVENGYWDPNNTSEDTSDDFWVDGDYHLKSKVGRWDILSNQWVQDDVTSPCIDAGNPSLDWGQELYPHGKRLNMGAYGGTIEASMSSSQAGNIADLNNDGIVNLLDLSILANRWFISEAPLREDINRDGVVDTLDLIVFSDNWLAGDNLLVYQNLLDESPNWTTQGQWEFGQPLGLGGDSYGNSDPNSGYTGQNVYGINLSGDYNTAAGNPYYLTTGPISCRHFADVKVSFMSWLNIDDSNYAQCTFEVSVNGIDWVTLWNNTPDPITDNEWNKNEFDISDYADDNPTLYLRWGYQIIDRAYPYSGWNIDDVELWGTL